MSEFDELNAAQVLRLLSNVVRVGTIETVDYDRARARVRFAGAISAWLPWVSVRAGDDRDWFAPAPGEQVLVLSPAGRVESGVIAGSIFQDAFPANGDRGDIRRVTFSDGTVCEYDKASHTMNVNLPAEGSQLNITTAGDLNLSAGESVTISSPLLTIQGEAVQTGGDFISGGVSLQQHTHGGVQSGGSNTSSPNS